MSIFGRGKNKEEGKPVSNSSNKNDEITTVVGEQCSLEGDIKTSSTTRIDGSVKGKISGENSLIIGEMGFVSGEIKASKTIVFGKVEGIVESNRLEIKEGGSVTGDIFTEALIVEEGGIYNGNCVMDNLKDKISLTSYSSEKEAEQMPPKKAETQIQS